MNENAVFNLHLDQKKPRYNGARAHNAEHDSETVAREMVRIKSLAPSRPMDNTPKKDEESKKKGWFGRIINSI